MLKFRLMKRYVLPLFFLLVLPLFMLSAQTASDPTVDPVSQVNVDLIPSNPGTNQTVKVYLTSYVLSIDSAKITWVVNGVNKKSGRGEKSFSFTTGNSGETTTLEIIVEGVEGDVVKRTITIKPADVDIVWESDGYVPPFYKGKSDYGHLNTLTLIALPHFVDLRGQEISPKNLIYKWTKNSEVLDWASGYGKDSFKLVTPIISRSAEIEVEVSSPTTGAMGRARINAVPKKPEILLYKKDPRYGIEFQRALKDIVELNDSKEIMVLSAPYKYEDPKMGNLVYTWEINGISIGNNPSEQFVNFRKKEGVSGISTISLSIENPEKILQYSSESFKIKFNETKTNETSL